MLYQTKGERFGPDIPIDNISTMDFEAQKVKSYKEINISTVFFIKKKLVRG